MCPFVHRNHAGSTTPFGRNRYAPNPPLLVVELSPGIKSVISSTMATDLHPPSIAGSSMNEKSVRSCSTNRPWESVTNIDVSGIHGRSRLSCCSSIDMVALKRIDVAGGDVMQDKSRREMPQRATRLNFLMRTSIRQRVAVIALHSGCSMRTGLLLLIVIAALDERNCQSIACSKVNKNLT